MMEEPRHFVRAMLLAVLGICCLVYANTFTGEFVWDDASSVLLHEHVQDPSSVAKLFTEDQHAFAGGQGNFYRPLLAVTFMVDFWLSNRGPTIHETTEVVTTLSPLLFHVQSMLWHALAAFGLFLLVRNLKAPLFVQAALPILYAVHPLHTEAVTYISGRADSMSAAFIMLGLSCATLRDVKRGWLQAALTCGCFVAGLLSKESTLIFPVLLGLCLFYGNRIAGATWSKRQSVMLGWSGALLGVYIALRSGPLSFGSDSRPPSSSFGARIVETVQSFWYYIELLVLPSGLHMERTLDGATTMTTVAGAAVLVILLSMLVVRYRRGEYRVSLGMAWFLVSWLPISGIFPLNAPMAEHWMYVPMAGFLWMVLELLADPVPGWTSTADSPRLRWVVTGLVCVWAVALAYISIERNEDWRSNRAIYEATIRENPNTSRVHFNLAVTHQDLAENPVGATRHYERVLDIHAQRKAEAGEEAATLYEEEIQSHLSLGDLYLDAKQYREAAEHYQVVASIAPNEQNRFTVGLALKGLGESVLRLGDRAQARTILEQAVKVLPELEPEVGRLLQI